MAKAIARNVAAESLPRLIGISLVLCSLVVGCTTSARRYLEQGCKVGLSYAPPVAPVATNWIDEGDKRIATDCDITASWWTSFEDPKIDELVQTTYAQNLTLRQAGFRILQARAARSIQAGNLFPQRQDLAGDYQHNSYSRNRANTGNIRHQFYNQYDLGFNISWELDFWGRFRRAVEAADAELETSVHDFDDILVALIGETVRAYVDIRITQGLIAAARGNMELQRTTHELAVARFEEGQASELDVDQAAANLAQTESTIPDLEIVLRQCVLQLCTLSGQAPKDLLKELGDGPIPMPPPHLCVGIPAELLYRRPDIRRADRLCAAECAKIGIAEAELYPHISIVGNIGYSSASVYNFFASKSLMAQLSPQFQWAVLNYGRLKNNILLHEAKLDELLAAYEQQVIVAQEEVERGLVMHLNSWRRAKHLGNAVVASKKAVVIAVSQFEEGAIDFNRVVQIQKALLDQQIEEAEARGNIALGMIQVYRALGGGWELGEEEVTTLLNGPRALKDRNSQDCPDEMTEQEYVEDSPEVEESSE